MIEKVLHLERKFTSKTETFIVNQINTLENYEPVVACIQNTSNLFCSANIITPAEKGFLIPDKYLFNNTKNSLYNEIKKINFKLIHAHYLTDASFFLGLVQKLDVPKIVSCYGYDVSSFPNRFGGLGKKIIRKVFDYYDKIIAMSDDMKKDIINLGCDENKIIVHYYGTDTSRFINNDRNYGDREIYNILLV